MRWRKGTALQVACSALWQRALPPPRTHARTHAQHASPTQTQHNPRRHLRVRNGKGGCHTVGNHTIPETRSHFKPGAFSHPGKTPPTNTTTGKGKILSSSWENPRFPMPCLWGESRRPPGRVPCPRRLPPQPSTCPQRLGRGPCCRQSHRAPGRVPCRRRLPPPPPPPFRGPFPRRSAPAQPCRHTYHTS